MSQKAQKRPDLKRRKTAENSWRTNRMLLGMGALAVAAVIGYFLYGPALNGAFVFDDSTLPFERDHRDEPLPAWMSGVRPVLMASYWLNWKLWGDGPAGYHVLNVLIHIINTALVFLLLWRLLTWANWEANRSRWTAAAGALVFLIHPLQTEAVSYVAGRSESLAMMFVLAAYVVYLWRRSESVSWATSLLVLSLFAVALATKENAISLAGLLLLTDAFWPRPFSTAGVRRNWRMYLLMLPGAILGAVSVFRMLATAPSAGFNLRTYTWYQYAFTQAGVIFNYIRLALVPIGLSIDHDYPPSHTILEHGAIFWMALLAAVTVLAILLRRQYPLATFGWCMFLVLLAPTSSIVPISDALVERRMYLPLVGLILIGCELSRHIHLPSRVAWAVGGLAAMLLAGTCYARNEEWSRPEDVLGQAAMQSRNNVRPFVNVAQVLVHEGRCKEIIPYLQRADQLFPGNSQLEVAWAWTLECLGKPGEALDRLEMVSHKESYSRLYEWIGLLYGEMNQMTKAGEAFHKAVALNPTSATAHEALALWYETNKDFAAAENEYRQSAALDPFDPTAQMGLIRARGQKQ